MISCSNCGNNFPIVNKKYHLCQKCNWQRLHPGEKPKVYELKRSPIKTKLHSNGQLKRIKQRSAKSAEVLRADEQTYEAVLERHLNNNWSRCSCEECGQELLDYFRDEEGKIVQRWRYSHILTKQAYPELRHNVDNFNILCIHHHNQWEFGDKKSMKIFGENSKKFPQLLLR